MNLARAMVAMVLGTFGVACGSSAAGDSAPAAVACDGGLCAQDAAPPPADAGNAAKACTSEEGLPQQKGDCKRATCDANGAIVLVNDDADVPVSDACAEAQCVDGKVVQKAKAAGTDCAGGKCDGKGACLIGVGTACSDNAACGSGFCVDGVCCDTGCRDQCKSCNLPGSKGVCSNIPYYEADPSYDLDGKDVSCDLPISGQRCNGAGKCLRIVGVPCNVGSQCMSNQCSSTKCLGAKGEICNGGVECVSGSCSVGACN